MNSFGEQNTADSLFRAGNYFEASIEYERVLFYSNSRETSNSNLFQKAMCYKNMGNYPKALTELQSIYFSSVSDTLFAHVGYQQAFCHYLNNEPLNALWKIDEYINRTHDSLTYFNFIPLKILCLNEQHEWSNAKNELNLFIQKSPITGGEKKAYHNQVELLYSKKSIPNIRSVKRAENLSRFIPGAGQVYAGKVGEGMVNFLINASILAFSAHQFYYKFYITGYLAGLGLFNQTYHGGIKRAGNLATAKNQTLIIEFNHDINELLIHLAGKK